MVFAVAINPLGWQRRQLGLSRFGSAGQTPVAPPSNTPPSLADQFVREQSARQQEKASEGLPALGRTRPLFKMRNLMIPDMSDDYLLALLTLHEQLKGPSHPDTLRYLTVITENYRMQGEHFRLLGNRSVAEHAFEVAKALQEVLACHQGRVNPFPKPVPGSDTLANEIRLKADASLAHQTGDKTEPVSYTGSLLCYKMAPLQLYKLAQELTERAHDESDIAVSRFHEDTGRKLAQYNFFDDAIPHLEEALRLQYLYHQGLDQAKPLGEYLLRVYEQACPTQQRLQAAPANQAKRDALQTLIDSLDLHINPS